MEDADIIEAYFRRDEDAITETKVKFGPHLYNLSFNILKNREDAEECENDTYVKAWNSIPPARPAFLCAWLAKIARNLSFDRLKEKRQARHDADTVTISEEMAECIAAPDGIERIIDDRTFDRVVNAYLESCDKVHRFAFVRRYYFGDGYEEIAKYTGKTKNNVRTMLYRMRGELRELLEKEGITE
ncbi:MAG: RNA polymerase sigma factor [Lachnospiraceae bacterium]|nr:RNA polymerase sigma factor [Lachnospiraceae bacterium]